jgi:hypothetical protein
MSKEPSELETIDPTALQSVQGGVTQAATDPNAQMEMMMQQLLSSIQDLAKSQQSGDGGMQQMMMMMMMMGGMGGGGAAAAPAPSVPVGGVTSDGWTRVS